MHNMAGAGWALRLLATMTTLAVTGFLASSCGNGAGSTTDKLPGLAVGECFIRKDIKEVPCSEPHTDEVIGSYQLPHAPKAGDDGLEGEAHTRCTPMANAYLAGRARPPNLQSAAVGPNKKAYDAGRKLVVCTIIQRGRPMRTGSFRD